MPGVVEEHRNIPFYRGLQQSIPCGYLFLQIILLWSLHLHMVEAWGAENGASRLLVRLRLIQV